jgi:antitoxin component of MazEF toxin-antitoxin module
MVTRVQNWGDAQGLRLGKELLSDAHIHVGAAVGVAVQNRGIVVAPVRRVRGALDLEQLVAAIPKELRARGCRLGSACRQLGAGGLRTRHWADSS